MKVKLGCGGVDDCNIKIGVRVRGARIRDKEKVNHLDNAPARVMFPEKRYLYSYIRYYIYKFIRYLFFGNSTRP